MFVENKNHIEASNSLPILIIIIKSITLLTAKAIKKK